MTKLSIVKIPARTRTGRRERLRQLVAEYVADRPPRAATRTLTVDELSALEDLIETITGCATVLTIGLKRAGKGKLTKAMVSMLAILAHEIAQAVGEVEAILWPKGGA